MGVTIICECDGCGAQANGHGDYLPDKWRIVTLDGSALISDSCYAGLALANDFTALACQECQKRMVRALRATLLRYRQKPEK